ncbi:MAG: hypothetical protein HOP31_04075 [Ignavibacteria bacterium]|nr:hypothetical protein [Ignavibacteria bacterium]
MKPSSSKSKNPKRKQETSSNFTRNERKNRFSAISGYVLTGLLIVLVGILATSKLFIDDDVFWHLATGRYIAGSGFSIPAYDLFGFVTAGTYWIPFEWGWDVLTYYLYNMGDYLMLSILRFILVLGIFAFLYLSAKRAKLPISIYAILAVILAFGMLVRFSVRPHLVTYAFLMLLLFLLYSFYHYKKNIKILYILPVIFLIWANMHMGVLLGAGIFFLFVITISANYYFAKGKNHEYNFSSSDLKTLLIIFLLSITALLLNPHFVQTYQYAISHSQMDSLDDIQEWKSPFDAKFASFYYIKIYYFYLLLALPVLYYSFRKKDLFTALLAVSMAVYSTQSLRFIYDYMIVLTIPAVISLGWLVNLNIRNLAGRLLGSVYLNIALIIITAYLVVNTYNNSIYKEQLGNRFRETGTGINEDFYPVQLAEFMKKEKITELGSNPFNNLRMGGFFIWNFPGKRNFIDSRNLNNEIMSEFKSIDQRHAGFEDKLDKYGIDFVMYSLPYLTTSAGDIEKNLIAYLSKSENWKLIYWDDKSFLFVRNIEKFREVISRNEYKYINPSNYIFRRSIITDALKNDKQRAVAELQRKRAEEPAGRLVNDMIVKLGL